MKGIRTILCLLGMMSLSFAVSAHAASVGTFTFLSGRVDVTSPGRTARPVQLHDAVRIGDIVRTKSQSRAEITFADGNVLRLAQSTRVEITAYMVGQEETKGSLHLFRGKIQSVVKTGLGRIFGREKRNRYEVHTPTAVCGVRGTNFFTWHTKAGSGAAFKEGRGYAYSTGRPEDVRQIQAGQAMLVVSPFDPPLIRPATPFELEQHFDDTRPEKSAKSDEPQTMAGETPAPVDTDEAKRRIREPDPAGEAKTSLQKAEEETGRTEAETAVSESKKLAQAAETLSQSNPDPTPADGSLFSGTLSLTGLDGGVLSGSLEKTGPSPEDFQGSGEVTISGRYGGPVPAAHAGFLKGTLGDGSAFQGYLGTAISSCRGDFSSLYVSEEGDAGFLYGHFSGSLKSEILSASGLAHRTSALGQTTFPAEEGETLSEALEKNVRYGTDTHLHDTCGDYYRLPVLGSINAGGGFEAGALDPTVRVAELALETPSPGATDHKIGVFGVSTSGGWYANELQLPEWHALYGEKGSGSPYYILGAIHGTDDLQGNLDLATAQPLTYMDTAYLGSMTFWSRGTYLRPERTLSMDSTPYQSAGTGLFDLNPLAFAGRWGVDTGPCPEGSLYHNDEGSMGLAGTDRGLMGGLMSPWDHDASPWFAMGEYSDHGPGGTYLWNTPVEGSDPRDPNRAFSGFSAGLWKRNSHENGFADYGTMTGAALTLYVDSGGAGYLTDLELSGLFYPDLGMWSLSGTWDRRSEEAVPSFTGFGSQNLCAGLWGHYEKQGTLFGHGHGETLFLTTPEGDTTAWGLYNLKLGEGNAFSGKPEADASWSAVAGGSGGFAAGRKGYWLAHTGGTWTATGEVTGDMSGTYLTESHSGNLQGPFWGINTVTDHPDHGSSGTWVGQSIGTFEGQPLLFNGSLEGKLMGMVRETCCCTCLKETGFASGLVGGLGDLWAANRENPAETRFMGVYDQWLDQDAPPVFSMKVQSDDLDDDPMSLCNGEDNTRNSAYYGYLAGRGMEDEKGEGTILALYLDKEGDAGILKGGLGLDAFAGLGMWKGGGTLFPVPLWDDTGYEPAEFRPENLLCTASRKGPMNGHGAFIGSFDDDTAYLGDISWTRYNKEVAALRGPDPSRSVLGVTSLLLGGWFHWGEDMDGDGPMGFNAWHSEFSFEDQHGKSRSILTGDPGSWSDEMITGKGYQAWVNWDAALTGVSGAELKGTFDPNSYTCQAATLWAFMDTNTFINLAGTHAGQQKLADLNIPCVEVGKVSLSGKDPVLDVTMHDVAFFAYSTGHDPRIWATNRVDGTYATQPGTNHTVPLHGGGLSADFQVRKWDSNRWGASIKNGAGTLNRTDIPGSVDVNFSGAAGGSYSEGAFSGTASGIAAPAPLALERVE
jgi:hypothetical protein